MARPCGTTKVVPFPPGQRPGSRALSPRPEAGKSCPFPLAQGQEVVPFLPGSTPGSRACSPRLNAWKSCPLTRPWRLSARRPEPVRQPTTTRSVSPHGENYPRLGPNLLQQVQEAPAVDQFNRFVARKVISIGAVATSRHENSLARALVDHSPV
jgi:hypothetical protein